MNNLISVFELIMVYIALYEGHVHRGSCHRGGGGGGGGGDLVPNCTRIVT